MASPQKEWTLPLTRSFPPDIQLPVYISQVELTTTSPAVILAPMYFIFVQSPLMTIFVSAAVAPASPATVKYSPSVEISLPWYAPSFAIWSGVLPANASGLTCSHSRKSSGVFFTVSVMVFIFFTSLGRIHGDDVLVRCIALGDRVVVLVDAVVAEELLLDVMHDLLVLVDLCIHPEGLLVTHVNNFAVLDTDLPVLEEAGNLGECLLDLRSG